MALGALLLGLLPFTVHGIGARPVLSAHCNGALIEAVPEGNSGGGWFGYSPQTKEVFVSGKLRSSICGNEARRRAVVPLMLATLGALALAAWALRSGPEATEYPGA
jgi:hypothetical protein